MGYHGNAVDKDEAQEFREVMDYLRNEKGLSWGKIKTEAGLEFKGGPGSSEEDVLKDAYQRKPVRPVYEAILRLYRDYKRRDDKLNKEKKEMSPVLTSSTYQKAINYIKENPGASHNHILKNVPGVGPKTLDDLERAGRVKTEEETGQGGKRRAYYLAEQAATANLQPMAKLDLDKIPEPVIHGKPQAKREETPTADSWESIRNSLLEVADRILSLADALPLQGQPESVKKEIREVFQRRHDRLIGFISEELEEG